MEMTDYRLLAFFLGCVAAVILSPTSIGAEEPPERSTVQERFAPKDGRLYVHGSATALIRDDYYHSVGYGADLGYYFNEFVGAELRAFNFHSRLGHAGRTMREEYDFIPDLRAPDALAVAGGRLSWGYGKVLTAGRFVVHFDPQWTLHGGLMLAERRLVPTATTGIGFLTHWQYGIQIKLDLQLSVHFERRNRGTVPATGFLPILSVGWSPGMGGPS